MLLTGDARGDYLLDGLAEQGLLDGQGKLHVDVLKMQHHGSNRNTEIGFFKQVTAEHYVASADGKHENPDRETFEMLVRARKKADRYKIHLTYEVAEIDPIRKAAREKAIAQALAKHKAPPPAWRDDKDALATFFAKCAASGYAFEVTTPATRATDCIDLLAPVDY